MMAFADRSSLVSTLVLAMLNYAVVGTTIQVHRVIIEALTGGRVSRPNDGVNTVITAYCKGKGKGRTLVIYSAQK